MSTTTTRRQYVNGVRRREQIVDAAADLFVSPGFGATSLRDIAARAGISHPGLLRHFTGKDEILAAVVERLERRNREWMHTQGSDSPLSIPGLARRNAEAPGYVQLFAMLAGEATSIRHPAHERMRERYREVREYTRRDLVAMGATGNPLDDATAVAAGWDGLQLMSLYANDGIDIPRHLEERLAWMRGERSKVLLPPAPDPIPVYTALEPEATGYAKGRERRARIVADASLLFARDGYHRTSLKEIAAAVGIPKATLMHHFGTKEDLLTAVLVRRDRLLVRADRPPLSPGDELTGIAEGAARSAREAPGLIEVYAVLSCEAASADHPAHGYFAQRFVRTRAFFTNLLERLGAEGQLAEGVDPERDGTWLVALWDGLQYQWLYEPDAVDLPRLLDEYARSLVKA
ncbi:TetR/AcrR family transcriptional regulator [Microbacterium sp. DT81.1]|uniref:TetR/AcrR family transcriptional regulator n=1 Tax=Microbacterium sp. DT81.1 TaxID=3393413 RepID=UPI003CF5B896